MRKRVSEVVTIKEVESWKQGDIVTIKAGTGAGKSYFIKNNLYAIAKRDNKKILMLIHRRNCTDQFTLEIEEACKTDNIEIRTYQSIEALEKNKIVDELNKFDFVVADEFHYFLGDASFNRYTDISLNAIINHKKAIRIFMSATGDKMKRFLTHEKHLGLSSINYEIPIDFNFIKRLEFYYNDSILDSYIEQSIKYNKKAIFFIQSARKAYELYKKYPDIALFNCGKSSTYYKHVDEEKIKSMLKNESFEEQILITTTVMDAGVNINDDELNHIVIDVNDIDSLIQCMGRKRLRHKNDHVILHIKVLGGQELGGLETKLKSKLKMPLHLFMNGSKSMVLEYFRTHEYSEMVYDVINEEGNIEKRLNELMFFKTISDVNELQAIKKKGKYGYCTYLSKLFNLPYSVYEEEEKRDKLEKYLNEMVGQVILQSKDRKELIEQINVRRDGKLLRSLNSLNAALEELSIDYHIRQFETSRTVNGKKKNYKSAWQVLKLTDNPQK